jgi:hypothetical protein
MFLNVFKDFNLKKIIKKRLAALKDAPSDGKVTTVGIIFDETYFTHRTEFVEMLIRHGLSPDNIETLSFVERVKNGHAPNCCHFTRKDIAADGTFTKPDVAAFLAKPFDLLISYYDVAKPPLLLATLSGNGLFKVGFGNIDTRLNHFMISSVAEHYDEFVTELFKYLKILNKI